jgi:hypothetical protein
VKEEKSKPKAEGKGGGEINKTWGQNWAPWDDKKLIKIYPHSSGT